MTFAVEVVKHYGNPVAKSSADRTSAIRLGRSVATTAPMRALDTVCT